MKLAFKDLETGDVYEVPAETGAVLGRERARCDIAFSDESISKRHARIAFEDGGWILQDLQSSNGTYVRGERVVDAATLRPGTSFSLAQRGFEVVRAEAPQRARGTGPRTNASAELSQSSPLSAPYRALARYVVAVPKLMFMPVGAIRATTGDAQIYSPIELALAGATGMGLAAALSTWVPLLASGRLAALATAWMPVVVAIAVGFVTGLLAHPVLDWVVRLLGGSADAASRTQFSLLNWALGVFAAVLTSIAGLLVFVSELAATIAVAVAGMWAILVAILAAVQWSRSFGVYRWLQYGVMGLGGLALVLSGVSTTLGILNALEPGRGMQTSTPPGALASLALADTPPPPESEAPGPTDLDPDPQATDAPSAPSAPGSEPSSDDGAGGADPAPVGQAPSGPPPSSGAPEPGAAEDEAPEVPLPVRGYVEYLRKRKAIEARLDDQPSLLRRTSVRRDYEKLWDRVTEIEGRWEKKRDRGWRRRKINDRLRDAEIYEQTESLVNRLYERVTRAK